MCSFKVVNGYLGNHCEVSRNAAVCNFGTFYSLSDQKHIKLYQYNIYIRFKSHVRAIHSNDLSFFFYRIYPMWSFE